MSDLPPPSRLQLLTPSDVAKLLQVSIMTVRRYVKAGTLESVRIGGQIRFTEQQLKDFVQRRIKQTRTTRKGKETT